MGKTDLEIFRANDPAMIHLYHEKYCPVELSDYQRKSCQLSRAQHFGSKAVLGLLWMKRRENEAILTGLS